jgi:SAM-dependent methyltransferase
MATGFDDQVRERWAGRAAGYERTFAPLCAYPAPALLDAAGVATGVRLLDAGTGPGTVAAIACARGAAVTAIDAEPGMVRIARRHAPAADVRESVLPDLPFPEGCFDAVVANFVINHVGDPGATMTELRRVVRPGGRIAVTVWPRPHPALQELWQEVIRAAGLTWPPAVPTVPAHLDFPRTAAGLSDLLARAGLSSVVCRELGWVHRTDPHQWWLGSVGGLGALGVAMTGLHAEALAEAERHYDRLAARYLTREGGLALPTAALLASGVH